MDGGRSSFDFWLLQRLHGPADHLLCHPAERIVEPGDGYRRLDLVDLLALLKQARRDDLSVLVENPRRQCDFGRRLRIHCNLKTPDIEQKLVVRLSGIRRMQRRVSDIVVLEALDQPGLKQLWNAVGPEKIREFGNILCGREKHSLRLEHRNRTGSGIANCPLMVWLGAAKPCAARRS